MTLLETILIAVGLAMDASAVSISAAVAGYAQERRQRFRLAFHFGLFQGFMPLLGWMLGTTVMEFISKWDHWVAFVLLGIVGGRMLYESFDKSEARIRQDPTRGWTLVILSIATSIDAFAVGLSFSVLDVNIFLPCVFIGLITLVLSLGASQIGRTAKSYLGKRFELLGGVILIGIGLRILISHLG